MPTSSQEVSERYTRFAELCREYAATAPSVTVSESLLKLAGDYERRALAALAVELAAHKPEPEIRPRRSNKAPVAGAELKKAAPRSAFRFANLERKPGLGPNFSEFGSD